MSKRLAKIYSEYNYSGAYEDEVDAEEEYTRVGGTPSNIVDRWFTGGADPSVLILGSNWDSDSSGGGEDIPESEFTKPVEEREEDYLNIISPHSDKESDEETSSSSSSDEDISSSEEEIEPISRRKTPEYEELSNASNEEKESSEEEEESSEEEFEPRGDNLFKYTRTTPKEEPQPSGGLMAFVK